MKILRLFTIRILLCAGLIAALALPAEAAATTVAKTNGKTATHRTTAKKAVKKTAKKASKKNAKKSAKKTTKTVAKPVAITGKYVSVAKDGVNVRATPSTDAESRWEIFEQFPLLIKKRQGAWLQVTDFEGDTGWIHESLVSEGKTVIACKKRINLRQDPNADQNNPIIANVKYGVIFTPLEKNGDWLKVRYDEKTEGWLKKDLVWPSDPLD